MRISLNVPATCSAHPGESFPLSPPLTESLTEPLTEPWLARSSLMLMILALGSGCAGETFTACKGDDCAHTASGGSGGDSADDSVDGAGESDGSAGAGNRGGGSGGASTGGGEAGADGSSSGTGGGEGGLGGASLTGTGGATAANASSGGGQTAGSGGSSTGGSSTGGSGTGPASTSASGSRLKRRTLDAGDGATMVLGFWDTELDVSCGFDEGADSTLGCIIDSSLIGDATFADPACRQPVYGEERQTCSGGWMRARASGKVYRATTTPVTLDEYGYFFETSAGDCNEVSFTPAGSYYEAELVPSSSFVGGVIETEERQDGLVSRYAVGDDGSRILIGTWFEARDYQCAFDERGYCLPVDRIQPQASYFEDAACSKEVFGFAGSAPPMISWKSSSDYCSDLEFFERGAEVTTGALYRLDSSGICVEETPAYSSYDFFKLGSKISLSTIPKAQREADGTGSLVARRWVDRAGDPLTEVDEFWDTTRDEACTPYATASGGYVCVPKNYADVAGNEQLDDSCSDTDQFAYALCPPETPRVAVRFGQRSCELANMFTVEAAYGVGAPLGIDYFENELNCDPGSLSDVYSAYETGESLLEDLPVLVLAVDE